MRKLWSRDWLYILAASLILFIPLYPKLPLADIIPGYLVRLRLEDLVVAFIGLVWFIQVLRRRITWNTFYFWAIIAYLAIGLVSILSGALLNQTIPLQTLHLGKSALTLFRYAEYFSLFMVGFAAITSPQQLQTIFKLLLAAVIGITIYGAGQKYFQWPVYSTMNREYAKGQALTLGEHAKVQSTFGGHYDLAAYLVIVLPLIFAFILHTKTWPARLLAATAELGGIWMLVLSGSKTSLLAAGLAHLIVLGLYLRERQVWRRLSLRLLIKTLIATIITGVIIFGAIFFINRDMALAFLNLSTKVPGLNLIVTRFYQPPAESANPTDWINADPIYEEKVVQLENGEKVIELVKKELDWSPNALKYGISMGIRLDTLWPNAITGLRRNPYLGSGYGTLNKVAIEEFTDSDSTDNNYLRTLGETGLIGFFSFYGFIVLLLITWLRPPTRPTTVTTVYSQALIGATIGLLFNAVYIDIFAASKVAFSFWLLAGMTVKGLHLTQPDVSRALDQARFKFLHKTWNHHWPVIIGALLLGLLTWRNPYLNEFTLLNKFNFAGDNYKHLVLARCFAEHNLFALCRPQTTGLPITFAPAYALVIAPIYSLLNHPNAFYFVNFALFNLSFFLVYLILSKIFVRRWVIFGLVVLFVLNPYLRASVLQSTSANLILWAVVTIIYFKLQLLPHFKRVYQVFFRHPATLFTLLVGGTIMMTLMWIRAADPLLNDFDLDEKSQTFQTIDRANLAFNRNLKNPPYLITILNPYFFDLYGNQNYQVLPYSPHQDLYANAQQVWGDWGFAYEQARAPRDLSPLYTQFLTTNPLYFTNYGIADFTDLRRDFSLKAVDLDCGEACNLYHLSEKKPLPQLIEPQTYNQIPLAPIYKNLDVQPAMEFIVVGHTYPDPSLPENYILPGVKERYSEINFAQRLRPLLTQSHDFLVVIGDLTRRFESGRYGLFNFYLANYLKQPLINVPQQLDPRQPTPAFQTFKVGANYLISLKTDQPTTLTEPEKMAFYNAFYDLEFSEVNYIFIFSYQDLSQNHDFIQSVVPKLNQLTGKSIYVIAGNGGEPNQSPTDSNHLNNVFFVRTGFNETTPAAALKFKVDPGQGLIMMPVEL